MAYNPPEPKQNRSREGIEPYVLARIDAVFEDLREQGHHPMIVEGWRSEVRQRWLYGVGRTHHLSSKPVTWTMHSNHVKEFGHAKAADICDSVTGFKDERFFEALIKAGKRHGLHSLEPKESCHLEWVG